MKKVGVQHVVISFDIISHEGFLRNDGMMCHFCNRKMIEESEKEAKKQGLEYIVDGSNLDDINDHRPGPQQRTLVLAEPDMLIFWRAECLR